MGDKSTKGKSKLLKGGRTGKQFGGPLARPGVMPARPLGLKTRGRTGKQFGGPLARPGVAPVRQLGFKGGARVKKVHGGVLSRPAARPLDVVAPGRRFGVKHGGKSKK